MSIKNKIHCKHIAQLPPMPSTADLPAKRKGSRKAKAPPFGPDHCGGHEDLGQFKVELDSEYYFEWNLAGSTKKRHSFTDLCNKPELEGERLELGWLIGNIYSLNDLHYCANFSPAGDASLNEFNRVTNWYEKKKRSWYRWAVAAPGHTLL